MNILTKISVVVLVLLVVAFCPVLISQATTQANYRNLYESREARILTQSQEIRMNQVAIESARRQSRRDSDRAKDAEDRLAQEAANLSRQLEAEKRRAGNLEVQLNNVDMTLKKLEKDLADKEDRNVKLVADVSNLNAEITKKENEKRALTDEVNRQTLIAERFQRYAEFLQQQLAQADEKVAELTRLLDQLGGAARAAKPAADVPTEHVGPDIIGTVTAVKGDIASINIGSAKGVKKGMVAIVSRGNAYICDIQIENVDTNQAAGVIVNRKQDPMPNDKILISSQR